MPHYTRGHICLWGVGRGSGWEPHCVKQHKRLQIQTFSNQRSNALDSAKLALTVSGLGHPHMDCREWKNSAIRSSIEPQKRKKIIVKLKRVSIKNKVLGLIFFQ